MNPGASFAPKVLVPLPNPVPPATAVRGTMVASSLRELKQRGYMDAYWEVLPESRHAGIRELVATTWVDIDLALAHYTACEALNLPTREVLEIGGKVGDRVQSGVLGTMLRSMRTTGSISPLSALGRIDRLWSRLVQGGAAMATQTGPKDAITQIHGCPFGGYRYNQLGWQGFYQTGLAATAKRVFVRRLPSPGPDIAAFAISWV